MNDREYLAAIERIRKLYPNDPCADLVSIDGFVLLKQYDKVIQGIDRLDKSIGGDPYLHSLRAGTYLAAGYPEKAVVAARAAIEGEPDLIQPHWNLIDALLAREDHQGILEELEVLDKKFQTKFKDLHQIPDYAKFVKTPQYGKWLEYLKNKAVTPAGPEQGSEGLVKAPLRDVSDEQAREFVRELLAALKQGDIKAVNERIDWDAIIAHATGGKLGRGRAGTASCMA